MQFRLYGKVVNRSMRKVTKRDGTKYDLYQMVIEEPGQNPSRFQVSSKDVSMFGQPDGPFGVGKFVRASGFVNGSERSAKRADGTPFTAYSTWFTLRELESAAPPESAPAAAAVAAGSDEVADDIPF